MRKRVLQSMGEPVAHTPSRTSGGWRRDVGWQLRAVCWQERVRFAQSFLICLSSLLGWLYEFAKGVLAGDDLLASAMPACTIAE